jgi:hypothetical protein
VATPSVFCRIVHDSGGNRVQVDVDQQLIKIPLVLHQPGLVPPLPEWPVHPSPCGDAASHPLLEAPQGTIERDHTAANRQVEMVGHQCPREHRQSVAFHNFAKQLDKYSRLRLLVEDPLTSTQPVVHVVHPTFDNDGIRPRHVRQVTQRVYRNSNIT